MKTILLLTLLRQTTAWCTAEGCQNEFERPLAEATIFQWLTDHAAILWGISS